MLSPFARLRAMQAWLEARPPRARRAPLDDLDLATRVVLLLLLVASGALAALVVIITSGGPV